MEFLFENVNLALVYYLFLKMMIVLDKTWL